MENRELQRLDSFLATLDPEEPVAIGASDGSGWLCFTRARDLDGYTPPLERFVVDTYCKEVDGPRLGIVIEGTEIGYWTESEAEEG